MATKKDIFENNDIDVIDAIDIKIKKPRLYKVILVNDDFTTMEFVIEILIEVFHKSFEMAQKIMLEIHHRGFGICGTYSYEIAETKVLKVLRMAKENEYPLQCKLEPE